VNRPGHEGIDRIRLIDALRGLSLAGIVMVHFGEQYLGFMPPPGQPYNIHGTADGVLPYVDEGAAEKLFRHKVLALLRRTGLLSQERIGLLNSWRRSGFSVHNRVFVHPRDGRESEALVRYMMARR
jgi:hypothetical protein